MQRLGVGEEQVKTISTGARGDHVCDSVRKGTERAKEALEMSSGNPPGDNVGLGRLDTSGHTSPQPSVTPTCGNQGAALPGSKLSQESRQRARVPSPERQDQLETVCQGWSQYQNRGQETWGHGVGQVTL